MADDKRVDELGKAVKEALDKGEADRVVGLKVDSDGSVRPYLWVKGDDVSALVISPK